jgi:ribulose-phosphate 3-epimerase
MNPPKSSPVQLGVKTDTIHTRYSYDWLFDLMEREDIRYVQLGAFLEIMNIDEAYFPELREKAEKRGLKIKSVFTSYRELGGYFYNHPLMEKVARRNHEQLIRAAAAVGADYCGTNPGAVYRDRPQDKDRGIATYLRHMKELMELARSLGLKALTIEPMSCLAEPPSTPEEIRHMMEELNGHHARRADSTVPVWLCGDISHGVADAEKRVVHGHLDLFRFEMPWMAEFHFKNTDAIYNSTFGFSEAERARGIIDLAEIRGICETHAGVWPVPEMVGYLEISGPKIGRDYTDPLVGGELEVSLRALKSAFR